MRVAQLVFIGLAMACEAFAYWGLATTSGRQTFDEMAGMIPLAAGAVGVLFAVVALGAWWRTKPSR